MNVPHFRDMVAPEVDENTIAARFGAVHDALANASSIDELEEAIRAWDVVRDDMHTWYALVSLRFRQNMKDEDAKAANDKVQALWPKVTAEDVKIKRFLLESPHREALEQRLGKTAFMIWSCDIAAFEPAIENDLVEEARLSDEYTELTGSAEIEFDGGTHNLSSLMSYFEANERDVRHEAYRLYWKWFGDNAAKLDRIYDDLTRLRHGMAKKLGFENYIGLGYKRMVRMDYDQNDVERYRQEVRDTVVPLCVQIRERQRKELGVDKLMYWDRLMLGAAPNAAPEGDHDWMLERATEMFDAMSPGLGGFFGMMREHGLLDLKARPSKAGGGFCTGFPEHRTPFIFANFNGTQGDVRVFTHEAGHAYQVFRSFRKFPSDYYWPTFESCEIHSMSLEFLTYPHMDKFFGDSAERFRRDHLAAALLFLPYGVAVDHFQHLVYERPDASGQERHEMWKQMERTYLPWIDYGDLERPTEGAFWQRQAHIYGSPFYYIDYTLAQACALQFWIQADEDPERALEVYEELCARGGEAPFQELVASAGLISPFEPGCLEGVVEKARAELGL